jgi:hypothetical protein
MSDQPHPSDTSNQPQSRGARFVTWWEALPVRRQFGYGYLAGLAFLLVVHLGGIATGLFPNLPVMLGIAYAIGEAVLVAGLIVFATRTEIMRKARENEARLRAAAAAERGQAVWAKPSPDDDGNEAGESAEN